MFIEDEMAVWVSFKGIIDSDFRVLAFPEILKDDTNNDVRTYFVCRFVNFK